MWIRWATYNFGPWAVGLIESRHIACITVSSVIVFDRIVRDIILVQTAVARAEMFAVRPGVMIFEEPTRVDWTKRIPPCSVFKSAAISESCALGAAVCHTGGGVAI